MGSQRNLQILYEAKIQIYEPYTIAFILVPQSQSQNLDPPCMALLASVSLSADFRYNTIFYARLSDGAFLQLHSQSFAERI